MFENWRFNPFTGTMNEVSITDEQHTVEYHADWNAYGIQLDEAPQLDNPSSLSIVESGTGGITFTEVPRTQAPSTGQFRVDYDAATYYGTGRIEFNAADNGKTVLVTYKGGGWIVKNSYRAFQTYIAANLNVTEDADIDGDLNVDGALVVDGTADIGNNLNVDGTLVVDGASTLTGAVSAPGGITGNLTGDVTGHSHAVTEANGAVMRWKIVPIGDWDMDGTASKDVAHGLTLNKIRCINVLIYNDNGECSDFNAFRGSSDSTSGSNVIYCGATFITLQRVTGGFYDGTGYDSTSFNRGYITIGYID